MTAAADASLAADPIQTGLSLPGNYWLNGLAQSTRWADGNVSWSMAANASHLNYAVTNSTVINAYSLNGSVNYIDSNSAEDIAFASTLRTAFGQLSDVMGLVFTETADFEGAGTDFRMLDVAGLSYSGGALNGIATFPGTDQTVNGGNDYEAYVLLANNYSSMNTVAELGGASNRLTTTMHEIGHSLGLSHPHDSGDGSTNAWGSTNLVGDDVLDNQRYTIMSYERGGLDQNTQNRAYGSSVTPMALDVSALIYMYGSRANHTGNTVYTLTDAGTVALDIDGDDGSVSIGRAFYCIWDTGGNDTLSYAGSNSVLLNLNEATLSNVDSAELLEWINLVKTTPLFAQMSSELQNDVSNPLWHAGGFFSRVFYHGSGTQDLGGYSIANNAYAQVQHQNNAIENATGGNQADMLVGNEQANVLTGNGGNDVLSGGSGDDILNGGTGADIMYGGRGNDRFFVDSVGDQVQEYAGAEFGADTVHSTLASYTLNANSEALILSGTYDQNGTGNSSDNWLYGNAFHNSLVGGAGNDYMEGFAGNDNYYVDIGYDWTQEATGAGIDQVFSTTSYAISANIEVLWLIGSATLGIGNNDTNWLYGNGQSNTLQGMGGNDNIFGYGGNDTLDGGAGTDGMEGGVGDDSYFCDSTGDQIFERAGEGTDSVYATASFWLTNNVENLILQGNENWSATGTSAFNYLIGNAGNNGIDAGGAADWMAGGGGADTFVLRRGGTHGDVIADFNGGGAGSGDFLMLVGFGAGANITALGGGFYRINSIYGNEVFNLSNGTSLDASDFFFS